MSVSKWAYDPDECDKGICVGDCDLCYKGEERAIQKICDILAKYLDRHPNKGIQCFTHIVDCKWKHEVSVVDRPEVKVK